MYDVSPPPHCDRLFCLQMLQSVRGLLRSRDQRPERFVVVAETTKMFFVLVLPGFDQSSFLLVSGGKLASFVEEHPPTPTSTRNKHIHAEAELAESARTGLINCSCVHVCVCVQDVLM